MCAPGNCPGSGPYFAIGVVLKIQELAGAHRVENTALVISSRSIREIEIAHLVVTGRVVGYPFLLIVLAASWRSSRNMRNRVTTILLNDRRGSEQYH